MIRGIEQLCCAGDIEVGVVGLAGEDQVSGLSLFAIRIDVVEISGAVETADPDVLRVAHAEVGVKGLFETKGSVAGICDLQLEVERTTDGEDVEQAKGVRPPALRRIVALSRQGDDDGFSFGLHGFEAPFFGADKAVSGRGGVVCLGTEPGKADWNSSADGAAVLPMRLLAEEEHLFFVCGLPGGDVGAMQIDLRRGRGGGDAHFGQAAVSGGHFGDIRNTKGEVQSVDLCLVHLGRFYREAGSAAASKKIAGKIAGNFPGLYAIPLVGE